jgi:hypothetical protein
VSGWWSKLARRQALLREIDRPADLVLVLQALTFASIVPLLVRLSLARLGSLLEPRRIPEVPDSATVRRVVTCVNLALRLGHPFVRPGCLTRGLTRYFFLRKAGLDVTLCFGMGRIDDELAGHCWLVSNGEPFLEGRDPRPVFAEICRLPDPNAVAPV